jgi:two-component system, OmpR family, response regulator
MLKKVLFINRTNPASVIPELLTGAGHEVMAVNNAGAGLDHLESRPYDMVILMENAAAESWKLCAEIRRRTASPFIIISSGAGAEACVKAISSGADFFMRKPFGPMELIARVNALFQRATTLQPIPIVS